MPPQSRGKDSQERKLSETLSPLPQSPLLDLPSPSAYLSDQQTPTGPIPVPRRRAHSDFKDESKRREGVVYDGDSLSPSYDGDQDFKSESLVSEVSPPSSPSTASDFDNIGSFPNPDDETNEVSPASGSEDEDQDGDTFPLTQFPSRSSYLSTSPPTRPLTSHPSYSSLHSATSHPGQVFAPPFYNRPPTPLPPSPSLTSLLRPPFSTTTSRPTTPDSSDVETPNDTEAAVAKSARRATTVPRASPKVPTYEYYGFGVYLGSSFAFLLYVLWSYLPSPFLHQLGVWYYPDRWWSLAIPAFIVMLVVYIYVALLLFNVEYLTKPLNSVECVVDEAANIAILDGKGRIRKGGSAAWAKSAGTSSSGGSKKALNVNGTLPPGLKWKNVWSEGTDAVMDIPIGGVCEVLYGEGRDDAEFERRRRSPYR
ncbi:MAG: hypothetical protein Q9227_001320 [Pyrenula ochraceoflavens]